MQRYRYEAVGLAGSGKRLKQFSCYQGQRAPQMISPLILECVDHLAAAAFIKHGSPRSPVRRWSRNTATAGMSISGSLKRNAAYCAERR